MYDLNFSQQDDIFEPGLSHPTTVIGAGSIGSWVSLGLARMGVSEITVYDGDSVESHNLPMSAYRPCDLGRYKTDSLKEIIREQTGTVINAVPWMYSGERLRGTVIACVDTMQARKEIFENCKDNVIIDLLVDTRVGEEFISIFAIEPCNKDDIEFYQHFLQYTDKETIIRNCGQHGFLPISWRVASTVCLNLTNFWRHDKKERHYRELCVALQRVG